jgi:hypothetical protein
MRHLRTAWVFGLVLTAACSSNEGSSSGEPSGGGDGGRASSGSAGNGGSGAGSGGGPDSPCEAFGHYGTPRTSFTLPAAEELYYPDVQASFPEVDWATLDRLYIAAGKYKHLNIGNLPERSADRPLIITNKGGQVQVGPDIGGNYIWSMGGGSNWILTGRYDPDSETGDEAFPGHRCGKYAGSRGKYGFLSDDAFDVTAPYLHMGISVGAATDFRIEFTEITRSGFAGIRLLNDHAVPKVMANVRLNDNYVHDVDAEGIYVGWTGEQPSNLMPGLEVYNNRFVRTGNEALQVQQLGEGSHVHHNVIAYAALHFRDNGLGAYQDNNSQVNTREGAILFERNVFMGSAGPLLSLWSAPEGSDGERNITFRENYFADNRVGYAAYFGGTAGPESTARFEGNFFRGLDFSYDQIDPGATDPKRVLSLGGDVDLTLELVGNRWQGDAALVAGLSGPNGTTGNVTATGNENGAVEPIEFVDGVAVGAMNLEYWTDLQTRVPGSPPRVYEPGDVVVYWDARLYECTAENSGSPPPDHPESWKVLPEPADDFRVPSSSPYAGYGVR